jgi:hypothetical protein
MSGLTAEADAIGDMARVATHTPMVANLSHPRENVAAGHADDVAMLGGHIISGISG